MFVSKFAFPFLIRSRFQSSWVYVKTFTVKHLTSFKHLLNSAINNTYIGREHLRSDVEQTLIASDLYQ